jgi:type II secretory pathway pseudopilin PulG
MNVPVENASTFPIGNVWRPGRAVKHSRSERGFTMIEIAIAVGVIGFALVAIIGILPQGMNVQKDNREETIISQDAPYFLNAIRNGEMRTNGNFLVDYVESITITNITQNVTNPFSYTNTYLMGGTYNELPFDSNIVGLLSTPTYDIRHLGQTNMVSAVVRAMSGSALEQNGANPLTAFRYQLTVEIAPWNFSSPGYLPNASQDYMNVMETTLHEVRLKFAWPVIEGPDGSIINIGPGRQTYRSLISSHLVNPNNGFWFFQPSTFTTNAP